MTNDPPIDGLVELDRPITPPPEADARVRARLSAALERSERAVAPPTIEDADADVTTGRPVTDISTRPATHSPTRRRMFSAIATAAAVLVIAALAVVGTREDRGEPVVTDDVPTRDVGVCGATVGSYLDSYKAYFESLWSGQSGRDELDELVAAQRGLVEEIGRRSDVGDRQRDTLESIRRALDEIDPSLSDPVLAARLGETHDALRDLLATADAPFGCDVTQLTWPPPAD